MWFWKRWKIKKWIKCAENPTRNILVPIKYPDGKIDWQEMTFGEYQQLAFPKVECTEEDIPEDDWLDKEINKTPEELI